MLAILTAALLLGCGGGADTGDLDGDGDGAILGEDCDDGDAAVFPGAEELCNERDDDCDGNVDEAAVDRPTWYADADGDDYGDAGQPVEDCDQPPSAVADASDCDDGDAGINPTALEYCDGIDQDCDGRVDENAEDEVLWNVDADGDGFGTAETEAMCPREEGYPGFADNAEDCDDASEAISPAAEEICGDGIDNNCSGDGDACELLGEEDLADAPLFIHGATSFNNVGESFSQGDLDGDGHPDLALGARTLITGEEGYEVYTGTVYVLYGPIEPDEDGGNTRALDTEVDATILPESQAAEYGRAVAVLGDVNGDGYGDLLASDPQWVGSFGDVRGAAWLFYGGPRLEGERDVSAADVQIRGYSDGDGLGTALVPAGDLSGDGLADLLLTAPGRDGGGKLDAGGVYAIHGSESLPEVLNLINPDAAVLGAEAGQGAGYSAATLWDNDGDGYADMLVGTSDFKHPAYLVRGPLIGDIDLAESAVAFTRGEGGEARTAVASAGDVDGDGLADVLIGSPLGDGADPGAVAGEAFLFYSSYGVLSGSVDLAEAQAHFSGEGPDQSAGGAVSGVGDIDGDGLDDIAIGAEGYGESPTSTRGAAYIFYGAVTGPISLADADARLRGRIGDAAGHALAGAGALDGGAFGSLWVGAPRSSGIQQEAGALYLMTGGAL